MFDYGEAIADTGCAIFINFYKVTPENRILTPKDTNDLIEMISYDYDVDIVKIERDLLIFMKKLSARIPQEYIQRGVTYH